MSCNCRADGPDFRVVVKSAFRSNWARLIRHAIRRKKKKRHGGTKDNDSGMGALPMPFTLQGKKKARVEKQKRRVLKEEGNPLKKRGIGCHPSV